MLDSSHIPKEDIHPARTLSAFKPSPELLAAFSKKSLNVCCKDDEVLFRIGESGGSVFLVRSGEVELTLPFSSVAGVAFSATAGSLVGLPAAFSNAPYSMTAVARKGSELGVMSRERFCDMLASDPAFSRDVLRILAAETRAARIAMVEAHTALR